MDINTVRGLYTVGEAARLLGVGRSTMYELVGRGEVASLRLGRRLLITRSTLESLLGFTPLSPGELASQSIPTLQGPRHPMVNGSGDSVNGRARHR